MAALLRKKKVFEIIAPMISAQQWSINNVNFSFPLTIFKNDNYGNIHNVS